MIRNISEAGSLSGKRVLVRVDWNVPIENGVVVDDFRIRRSLPTIEFLQNAGAKVIMATHLEPEEASLEPLQRFVPNGAELLPNLRSNPGEKANDVSFAKELASLADIFVNEAFSASHREHASIVGVPKLLPSFAGIEFVKEVESLSKAFEPEHPFVLILGGAKFETKLPLLKRFLDSADTALVGGALANDFWKSAGIDVGDSLVSNVDLGLKNLLGSGKIILPADTTLEGDRIVDAGSKTIEAWKEKIDSAKFILWNGPLGEYEKGYKKYTLELAKAVATSGAKTIVGGADTLAAIMELDIFDRFGFVSTGGGAMLDFLSTGTLPGIKALEA